MLCNFLSASLLITLTRAEENVEKQLQESLKCRKHVNAFRECLNDQLESLEVFDQSKLLEKFACLLAFDFEAAVRLKAWPDLTSIVNVRVRMPDTKLNAQTRLGSGHHKI